MMSLQGTVLFTYHKVLSTSSMTFLMVLYARTEYRFGAKNRKKKSFLRIFLMSSFFQSGSGDLFCPFPSDN